MVNRSELTGINEILAEIRRRGESASKRVETKALKAAGKPMAKAMSERAARSEVSRRFHLQDNIVVSGVKSEDGKKYVLVGPNKKVAYRSHFVEFGTSHQSAEPYIQPGFNATKEQALQIIADELRKGLRDED